VQCLLPLPEKKIPEGRYSQGELEKKNLSELVSIIKTARWRKGASGLRKPEVIKVILESQVISLNDRRLYQQKFKENASTGFAEPHAFYKKVFNVVDLHDAYWNEMQNHHTITKWKAKMTLSIIQTGFINAFTIYKFFNPSNRVSFSNFCVDLCEKLLVNDDIFS
jgi:hypothetical protein